jgi:hypothetical protein
MESAAERKARLKALRAAAEESGVVPARDPGDECVARLHLLHPTREPLAEHAACAQA